MSLIRSAFAATLLAFALLYGAVAALLMTMFPAATGGPLSGVTTPARTAIRTPEAALTLATVAFAVVGAVLAAVLYALHQRGMRPLERFEAQIRALGERRFVAVVEPDIVEWVRLSKALNVMVSRVQHMLDEQGARLAGLQAEVDIDTLTGAASRAAFIERLQAALQQPAGGGDAVREAGAVAIVRVHDLIGMNQRVGRGRSDDLLRGISTALRTRLYPVEPAGALLARLNGADFALLLPGVVGGRLTQWLESVVFALRALHEDQVAESTEVAWVGVSTYRPGEPMADVLSRCDAMIGTAETRRMPYAVTSPAQPLHTVSLAQWRTVLEHAIATGGLYLDFFAVRGRTDTPLHREAMARLRGPGGEPIPAAIFIPPAVRTGRIVDIDLRTVALALAEMQRSPGEVAVKLSPRSLGRPMFASRIAQLLAQHREVAPRLWIEVDEAVLDGAADDFERLLATVAPFGCRMGLEHVGHHFSSLPRLIDLRLAYIKIDAVFCDRIQASPGQRAFVDLAVRLARAAGILVIAQGVRREVDLGCLVGLGVDGATGPWIGERARELAAAPEALVALPPA